MYKTDFKNVNLIKGKGFALREAFKVFCRLFYKPKNYRVIRDSIGRIGYEIGSSILVAKKSFNGDVVSVHKNLVWDKAIKKGWKIILYLAESGYFYRFDPVEIKDIVENERCGQKMVNFSLKNGRNLMKLKAESIKADLVVEKNHEVNIQELAKLGVFG